MTPDTFIGAIGFQIFIATGEDVSAASDLAILYRKPDGSEGEWVATAAVKNLLDGAEYVTTADTDLDQAGVWTLDVEVTGLAGFTGVSTQTSILVGRPLAGAPVVP